MSSESMMYASDFALATFWQEVLAGFWHTATQSAGAGNCVEVADLVSGRVAVRDSKNRDGSVLVFEPDQWDAFIAGARAGQFG